MVLQTGNIWWNFFEKNKHRIKDHVVQNIVKILSCGLLIRGYQHHFCENPDCSHIKRVPLSCCGRYCPTCGKIHTIRWSLKQSSILPKCSYQHITFTMPDKFWLFFKDRPDLQSELMRISANVLLESAKKKNVLVVIFSALHTFGRDLKWNVHVHASVTMGGLTDDLNWKKIRFAKKAIMPMWRYQIVTLLRREKKLGNIEISNQELDHEYNKFWNVHLAEPTDSPEHTLKYLSRYIKKPPISMSRLLHYDGKTVTYNYLNHRNKKHEKITFNAEEFIERFIQHIPENNFRLIRYYGFC